MHIQCFKLAALLDIFAEMSSCRIEFHMPKQNLFAANVASGDVIHMYRLSYLSILLMNPY